MTISVDRAEPSGSQSYKTIIINEWAKEEEGNDCLFAIIKNNFGEEYGTERYFELEKIIMDANPDKYGNEESGWRETIGGEGRHNAVLYDGEEINIPDYSSEPPNIEPEKDEPEPAKPEPPRNEYTAEDGKDDGSIGFFDALKHIGIGAKNGLVNMAKSCAFDANGDFSPLRAIATGATVAASIAFPPLGIGLCTVGGIYGTLNTLKGVREAVNATTDKAAQQAFEGVGEGISEVAVSAAGAKGLKGLGKNPKGESVEAIWNEKTGQFEIPEPAFTPYKGVAAEESAVPPQKPNSGFQFFEPEKNAYFERNIRIQIEPEAGAAPKKSEMPANAPVGADTAATPKKSEMPANAPVSSDTAVPPKSELGANAPAVREAEPEVNVPLEGEPDVPAQTLPKVSPYRSEEPAVPPETNEPPVTPEPVGNTPETEAKIHAVLAGVLAEESGLLHEAADSIGSGYDDVIPDTESGQ